MNELKHLRSTHTDTLDNGDGTRTQRVYSGHQYYDNFDGIGDGEKGLRKIDVHPIETPDGWRVEYAPYRAYVPRYADLTCVFIDAKSPAKIEITITPTCEHAEGIFVPKNNEVVYTDAFGPGASLVYVLLATGIRKLVRVSKDSNVAGPFVFAFGTDSRLYRRGGTEYELDRRGPKTLDTSKLTALKMGTSETYIMPYQYLGGEFLNHLAVEMRPAGSNTWELVKTIPSEWDKSCDLEMDATVSISPSNGAQLNKNDLAVYIDAVRAPQSVSATATTGSSGFFTFARGSGVTTPCVRTGLIFNNTLIAGDTITAASIEVRCTAVTGAATGYIVEWAPANYNSITTSDYDTYNGPSYPVKDTALNASTITFVVNTYISIALNPTGLNLINKGGANGFIARATEDIDTPTYLGGILSSSIAYSGNATTAFRPYFSITYTPTPSSIGSQGSDLAAGKTLSDLAA